MRELTKREKQTQINAIGNILKSSINSEKRYVYGTRDNNWHLVDKTDRDFIYGIPEKEFIKMNETEAKIKYLSPSII